MSGPALSLTGQLVLPDGVRAGRLTFGRTLQDIEPLPQEDGAGPVRYVLPGFVDTHVHGGGGGDTMDGVPGVQLLARRHARCGTTTLLPTTMTAPWPQVMAALHGVAQVMRAGGVRDGADIPGAHLEGPFISPGRLGAQPPCAVLPTPDLVGEVLQTGVVRAVTLAPELDGALEAARAFAQAGVRVGVGHTRADADTVTALLDAAASIGRVCGTHLFNAMGGIAGRDPGPPGALLAHPDAFAEIILDGHHLHPVTFRLAAAAAPDRVMLITDAMRAAGEGDGPSELGGQPVQVTQGRATLQDGTLAGSVLTMDQALRNALAAGIPLPEASRMASAHPARSLGLNDRGELRVAQRADLVVLDETFHVVDVYLAGERLPRHPQEQENR